MSATDESVRVGDEPLLGPAGLERLAAAALDTAGAADVEVIVDHGWSGLTRFANSRIHQNVWSEDVRINVRVVTDDGRVGVVGGSTDDPAGVEKLAATALRIARVSPVDHEFAGLAPADDVQAVPLDPAALDASPQQRADAVGALLSRVPAEYEAAGAYTTGGAELAVFTTAGQRVYSPLSYVHLTLVVMGATSSGYAEAGGRRLADVDATAAAATAVRKAELSADPVEVPAGPWPVVLEPAAVGALVQFLAWLGFGGKEFLEGRSFAAGRLGERVVDEKISLVDDACSTATIGYPFDYEGTPKQRVDLLREGVLAGVVHDRHTASVAGTTSTGHALPAPNPDGPIAINPVLLPGDDGSIDDLVGGLERGLLVTRFHYTNVVHPLETTITGMTRDGTFLVEDGRITKGVRNLRYVQSILEALATVDAVSSETSFASELFFGGSICPALRLPSFTFSGTTTFG